MKILHCLAINPQWYDEYFLSFPLGLATIVAVIKREGFSVDVVDFNANRAHGDNKKEVLKNYREPDIVLLSGMITTFVRVRELVQIVRKLWPNSIIILGGGLASTAPDSILKKIDADIYVIGEGDEKIVEVLNAIESKSSLKEVSCIKLKNGNNIYSTNICIQPPDISKTPRPDYESFPMNIYLNFLKESGRCAEMYTSKGCPFNCAFCYRISGSEVRNRLVSSVINEIRCLKDMYALQRFSFEDDNFGVNKEWVDEFCLDIKELKIKFRFQANANILNENLLEKLQNVGLEGVSLGIESGSSFIIREMGKNINLLRAEKAIELLRRRGIKYNASFIIGSPSESYESIEMTRDFLMRNGFKNNFQLFFLTPYPGTKLYNDALVQGKIIDEISYLENLKLQDSININLTQYSDETLLEWKNYIIRGVTGLDDHGVTWKRESV